MTWGREGTKVIVNEVDDNLTLEVIEENIYDCNRIFLGDYISEHFLYD